METTTFKMVEKQLQKKMLSLRFSGGGGGGSLNNKRFSSLPLFKVVTASLKSTLESLQL